jgi:hypothetical protein
MEINNMKCVMIFDESLPVGVIANTAAIMGASLGKADPEVVGITPVDMDGNEHSGLIQFPVPILKSDSDTIQDIRKKALDTYGEDIDIIDFTDIAQKSMTYDDYLNNYKATAGDDISYLGLTLCGPKKAINKLTGNLSLLR